MVDHRQQFGKEGESLAVKHLKRSGYRIIARNYRTGLGEIDIIAKDKGTIALVSHRVVNKVLICALLGLDNSHFWNIRQDTCGISTFTYENGRFILTKHNDTSYLKPIQRALPSDF